MAAGLGLAQPGVTVREVIINAANAVLINLHIILVPCNPLYLNYTNPLPPGGHKR